MAEERLVISLADARARIMAAIAKEHEDQGITAIADLCEHVARDLVRQGLISRAEVGHYEEHIRADIERARARQ